MKMYYFSNSPVSRSTFARIQCILYGGVHSANPISVHHGHFHLFHKIHYLLFFSIVLLNIIPTNTSSSPLFSSPPQHKFFLQDDPCFISLPGDSILRVLVVPGLASLPPGFYLSLHPCLSFFLDASEHAFQQHQRLLLLSTDLTNLVSKCSSR